MANTAVRVSQRGQVLVFFALALPVVLLPVAAYAVDAAMTSARFSRLVEVTARAAEEAAQQVDATRLRSGGGVAIDKLTAREVAGEIVAEEPGATVVTIEVVGVRVTVATTEEVRLPLDFVGSGSITLHARAIARLTTGYDSPSSLLPLPTSTF